MVGEILAGCSPSDTYTSPTPQTQQQVDQQKRWDAEDAKQDHERPAPHDCSAAEQDAIKRGAEDANPADPYAAARALDAECR